MKFFTLSLLMFITIALQPSFTAVSSPGEDEPLPTVCTHNGIPYRMLTFGECPTNDSELSPMDQISISIHHSEGKPVPLNSHTVRIELMHSAEECILGKNLP